MQSKKIKDLIKADFSDSTENFNFNPTSLAKYVNRWVRHSLSVADKGTRALLLQLCLLLLSFQFKRKALFHAFWFTIVLFINDKYSHKCYAIQWVIFDFVEQNECVKKTSPITYIWREKKCLQVPILAQKQSLCDHFVLEWFFGLSNKNMFDHTHNMHYYLNSNKVYTARNVVITSCYYDFSNESFIY